jgi:hypothetical protein
MANECRVQGKGSENVGEREKKQMNVRERDFVMTEGYLGLKKE